MIREIIQQFFSKNFQKTSSSNFHRYFEDFGDDIKADDLPDRIKQAYGFYKENVEEEDWGSVRVYKTSVKVPVYAVYTSTDGDDGYLEIFTQSGEELAVGKHDADKIDWSDRSTIRGDLA